MQSYPINMPAGGSQTFSSAARRFVYESGQTEPIGGDARIIVKPDNGNEIVLRPGQSFGLAPGETAGNWYVRAHDPASAVSGTVIIGSGDFNDGTFKVDSSTGTIAVRPEGGFVIENTEASRVPVSLDIKQIIKTEAPVVRYTHYWGGVISPTGTKEIVAPSANTHGIIVELAHGGGGFELMAGFTMPNSVWNGEAIAPNGTVKAGERFYIAPGKGLWANIKGASAGYFIAWTQLNAETA